MFLICHLNCDKEGICNVYVVLINQYKYISFPGALFKSKTHFTLTMSPKFPKIGPSEVRALPVRRCRRAAWQT